MNNTFRIVAVQSPPRVAGTPVEEFASEVAEVVARHPDVKMVVFPELHLFHSGEPSSPPDSAPTPLSGIPIDGEYLKGLATIASDLGVWLIPGSINEQALDGKVYNTALVFNPEGNLVASYRKIFPWRPFETHAPGTSFSVFDIPGVARFGLSTCYDMWFPETTRSLTWMGAHLIVNLVKTTTPDRAQEIILARANAIANQVVFLSVNSAGPVGYGHSIIAGAEGEVLAEQPDRNPAELVYDFDPAHVERVRSEGTAGTNRMWQQFQPGDAPITLPIYHGYIDPSHWTPRSGENTKEEQQ